MAIDPRNVGREERWFETGPTDDAQPAPVPGIIQQVYPEYHGVAWYWRTVPALEALGPHRRYQLHFEGGVDYLGEVWLNGQYLGSCEGGEGPFDLGATEALRPGEENLLAVRVLSPGNEPIDGYVLEEVPHRNRLIPYSVGASFACGGILLGVELRVAPLVRVVDLFARPDLRSGMVPVSVTLRNDSDEAVCCQLVASIGPAAPQGPAVVAQARGAVQLEPGAQVVEMALPVAEPRAWQLDDPYLYRVVVHLQAELDGTSLVDEHGVRCGFRDLCVEKGFFRLNGKRIFVRSTHTCNHFPFGLHTPMDSDLVRRDLINAKACGFNMVRFVAGTAMPEQLDFCDEIGLLVYEECYASWCLADSPHMAERFDRSTRAMVLRDRNHPSVVIWGLLNETAEGPVFRQACGYLPRLREVDPTRLVLLNSGRWDGQWSIGSVCNPGSLEWEHEWGGEAPAASPAPRSKPGDPGGYLERAGDAHVYPTTPQTAEANRFLRTLGQDTKPVFLSEYGIGSLLNVIREVRRFEQVQARPDLMDVALMRSLADRLVADWERLGFEGVYAFPEDMLRDSQRLHARQRLLGFDLIRANPNLCGYSLTGMIDHVMAGEGLWTITREWKPGIVDALADGWAPLRWCLFVDPLHGYIGRPLRLEAVLANEDVLQPGTYPVTFRITGSRGVVWEKQIDLRLRGPAAGEEAPLAVPVFAAEVELSAPPGVYEFAACMKRGGAPAGGRLRFYLSAEAAPPAVETLVTAWGIEPRIVSWLQAHRVHVQPFAEPAQERREVILVGVPAEDKRDDAHWTDLAQRVARGGAAIFLSHAAFAKGEEPLGWLPLPAKGRCYEFGDWLYHKECVAKAHPAFAGLQAGGIMDWDYWGTVIPHDLYDGQDTPEDVAAAAFAVSYPCPGGYASGVLLGSYAFGAGRFTLNTLSVAENIDRHPAADRLLLNLLDDARRFAQRPPATLPASFASMLKRIGYTA